MRSGAPADLACREQDPTGRYEAGTQGPARTTRVVEAGFRASFATGRMGRRTSSPPQLAQTNFSFVEAHSRQNVHSNVQM